jgi:hypothetical protein
MTIKALTIVTLTIQLLFLLITNNVKATSTCTAANITNTTPLHLLILGASGKTGKELTSEALCRGHSVTLILRKPNKELERTYRGNNKVRVLVGDILDKEFVWRAVNGHDAVLSALGYEPTSLLPWTEAPKSYLANTVSILLEAMKAKNVKRLIFLSGAGSKASWSLAPLPLKGFISLSILRKIFKLLEDAEDIIVKSHDDGIEYEIVKPMVLTDEPRTNKPLTVISEHPGLFNVNMISRADVARFMLDEVEQEKLRTTNNDNVVFVVGK